MGSSSVWDVTECDGEVTEKSRSVTEKRVELSTMWGSVECVEVRGWE